MDPTFFATPAAFRKWLAANHATAAELWVGFHKKGTGRPSLTWPESVDEALCVGWIDGIRKSIDADSYKIRFTPRRATSVWSAVNVKRIGELMAEGRVLPAGIKAFEGRSAAKTGIYAYEQRGLAKLDATATKQFRASKAAWAYFQARPAGYRKLTTWWVVSAKKPETRQKRLAMLIECCAAGKPIPGLIRPGGTKSSPPSA
ncbi:MAG: YdeI/OmpD-associated family protein [Gemmataceae bacterium]